jgi:PAS domain S-box-containing protein
MAKQCRDLSRLLRISETRAKAAQTAALDAIVVFNREGRCLDMNPAAEALFGFTHDEMLVQPLTDFIIPERLREAGLLTQRLNERFEQMCLRADGMEFPAEIAIVPIDGETDPVFAGFIRDISDRKHAEQRQTLLLSEITHRSNNLFAVVQAIVQRTLRDYPPDTARTIIDRRITALARSHAGLAANPTGAPLAQIVAGEVEGFSNRAHVAGPEVLLTANAAQTLSLIVHELATNALKHGALASDGGRIDITWSVSEGDAPGFVFDWRERGGPAIAAPTRTGFGRTVLEQIAASEFKATPQMAFAPTGMTYHLETRLSAVSNVA